MKKLTRQNMILFLLAILLSLTSFLFFRFFLDQNQWVPPFATEIAAVLLGSILTVVITAILLNKQTETEMLKERNSILLAKKIEVYDQLMQEIEAILTSTEERVAAITVIKIQILNQKISFLASEDVLKGFHKFADTFSKAAKDSKFTQDEMDDLIQAISELSLKIRYDLASEEERLDFDEKRLKDLIQRNTSTLLQTYYQGRVQGLDGILPLFERGEPIFIGFNGGRPALEKATLNELAKRRYKWDDNLEGKRAQNWIPLSEFRDIVAAKGWQPGSQASKSSPNREAEAV